MFEAILVFTKDGRNQPLNIIPFLCKAQDCEISVYLCCWWLWRGERNESFRQEI